MMLSDDFEYGSSWILKFDVLSLENELNKQGR